MEQKMIKTEINGKVRKYPEGITFEEIVKAFSGRSAEAPIILVTVNGKLKELHKKLKRDCCLNFITTKDNIGHNAYKRSACMLLLKAIYDVAGKDHVDNVVIHYSLGSGYYFTMKGSAVLSQEFLGSGKRGGCISWQMQNFP